MDHAYDLRMIPYESPPQFLYLQLLALGSMPHPWAGPDHDRHDLNLDTTYFKYGLWTKFSLQLVICAHVCHPFRPSALISYVVRINKFRDNNADHHLSSTN
jgi:hypothetical protein